MDPLAPHLGPQGALIVHAPILFSGNEYPEINAKFGILSK
jgi:hypothetical protein